MHILNYIVLLGVVAASHGESIDVVADLHFPKGAEFGMDAEELKTSRPTVMLNHEPEELPAKMGRNKSTRESKPFGKYGAVEIQYRENGIRAGYLYHFKEGRLGAIGYGWSSTNMLADAETDCLYKKLSTSDGVSTNRQTARAGQAFTVKCWTLSDPAMEVCFEASSRGTGIMFFSPDYFSFEDLFPDASEAEKQAAVLKKMNEKAERVEKREPSIDRLSTNAPPHAALTAE